MDWQIPNPTPTEMAIMAKVLLDVANSLRPPKMDCWYWVGFLYDLMQNLAGNKDKAGTRTPIIPECKETKSEL